MNPDQRKTNIIEEIRNLVRQNEIMRSDLKISSNYCGLSTDAERMALRAKYALKQCEDIGK